MSRRATIWMVVAVVFILGNIAGGVYAAALGEPMHASLHAALALLGLVIVTALARGRVRTATWGAGADSASTAEITDRLQQLEQSMDAVAIEVERIGEGQRFVTRVLTQDRPPVGADGAEGAPQPVRKQAEEKKQRPEG